MRRSVRWHSGDLEWSQDSFQNKQRSSALFCKTISGAANARKTLKVEIDRLVELGALEWTGANEWAVPTFIMPKKNRSVCFMSDFRKLNSWQQRAPYLIPKMQDSLHEDLNVGCYHVKLNPDAQKCCTIITQWGCLSCLRLPMGISSLADMLQERMSELMRGLELILVCTDDVLLASKTAFLNHLFKLDEVLRRMRLAGFKVNAKNPSSQKTNSNALGTGLRTKAFNRCRRKQMR
jgi:hypothetical protein